MALRFGFISTYPPTQCGLATFTASLLDALGAEDPQVGRLLEAPQGRPDRDFVTDIVAGDPRTSACSMDRLNRCDVVIVQHEFGIFGGPDGDEVLAMLAALDVPTIVVLHTVLTEPTVHQREVFQAVLVAAGAIVTMTDTARRRLLAGYRVDAAKVRVIAHGAPGPSIPAADPVGAPGDASATVLTWGLLGPGKGIEWGIEAMALLRGLRPAVRYVVAGQTHPKVAAREGEAYRRGLQRRIEKLSLAGSVRLDGRYLKAPTLAALVATADVVLLPYDSTEQVTSGVLIEAVAASKPVVATRFPHAVELLSDGAGIVVPHRDPVSIAEGLRRVIMSKDVALAMSRAASAAAPGLRWSAVAEQYRSLATRLIAATGEVAA
jgi:glycosyltransferase involved in cell wall biosynthesis